MAKLQKSESLKVAEKVLKLVNVSKEASKEAFVSPYHNGREKGFTVMVCNKYSALFKYISFSQIRNSDGIVVYVGEFGEYFNNGMPTDRAYQAAKYFSYNEEQKAADFIAKTVETAVNARKPVRYEEK